MKENNLLEKNLGAVTWLTVLLCVGAIIAALAFGAAYTGIQSARVTAAKASIGQIEALFYLAENEAREQGLVPPTGAYHILKSYDNSDDAALTPYEKYVRDAMVDAFGDTREFDFAVTRFDDGAGMHTQIYYFPQKGQTDTRADRYYVATDGAFQEKNT